MTGSRNLIVVTGFGPFVGHEDINASWQAVRLLPDTIEYQDVIYKLKKMEIPVEYTCVDNAVESIWSQDPILVIHCGVNGYINCIHIEKFASNGQFNHTDYKGNCLPNATACLRSNGTKTKLCCSLDLNQIIDDLRQSCKCFIDQSNILNKEIVAISNDIGNYLCGYIYLKSLDYNSSRCLFIHIPPINKPLSSYQVSQIIEEIINKGLKQIVKSSL